MKKIPRPVYPRLSCKQDKRYKLCDADVKKILKLRKKGDTVISIAEKFNVSPNGINYLINPKYAETVKKSTAKILKKRYKEDAKFRKYLKNHRNTDRRKRKKEDPEYLQYTKDYDKFYASTHKEQKSAQARKRYLRKKEAEKNGK